MIEGQVVEGRLLCEFSKAMLSSGRPWYKIHFNATVQREEFHEVVAGLPGMSGKIVDQYMIMTST
jgi:hypothetical protein